MLPGVQESGGSQIGNLIPAHKKLVISPILLCASGMRHIVGKLLTMATLFFKTSSQLEVYTQSYGPQSCGSPNFGNFEIPETKCYLCDGLVMRHKIYYKGEGDGFPQV
jgi:hypothetical protein